MIDHASLSASQEFPSHFSQHGQEAAKRRKNPVVVTNLSASIEHFHRYMSNLDEVFQGVPEMTSSIVLTKILATNYTWQEKEALKLYLS